MSPPRRARTIEKAKPRDSVLDSAPASSDSPDPVFRADVLEGLARSQKVISARWFYDSTGSALFDKITSLPEYYLTRSETNLLVRHAHAMAARVRQQLKATATASASTSPPCAVVEFGAGSARKTPLLLEALAPAAYVPIDIAGDYLRSSAKALAAKFPQLAVHPIEADFTQPLALPAEIAAHGKLGFFPGSTIGNFAADTAVDMLRGWRRLLGADSLLLIGIDRIKDVDILHRAYDDKEGVTAAFNLNLLVRINRELGGNIPLGDFAHRARWNDSAARIEMHLEAKCDMTFTIAEQTFSMHKGETIHSENSYKYGVRDANLLLRASGWTPLKIWDDVDPSFALILARATLSR